MTETVEQRIQFLQQHLSSQPRSPLFAQLAGYYLDAGKARDALDLCDKGLSLYPFYPTAHLIKGKALLTLNMPAEARREFEFVQGYFPRIDSLTRLLRDLPSEDIGTAAAPPASQEPEVAQIPEPQPSAGQQTPTEPITAEANPDQWLAQFTEATAAAPEAAQVAESTEAPVSEASETFSLPGETPEESRPEVSVQPDDIFGIAAPQEAAAEAEPSAPESASTMPEAPPATTQTGESFQDFTERKKGELFGLENSISLDEYLAIGQPPLDVVPESTESPVVAESTVAAPEDPFAALTQQFEEPLAEAVPQSAESPAEDPFAALTQQFEEPPVEPPVETPPEPALGDPFAQLGEPTAEMPASPDESVQEKDQIEELADKLKNAKKITPIIDLSERAPVPPSESETPSGTGFVTPTLAEIYAKQGWYDDAIKAYRALALTKPAEKDKFERRIQELEELKKQQESG